jgi:hypothetical protein
VSARAWIEARAWQIGTGVAAATALTAGGLLVAAKIENAGLEKVNSELVVQVGTVAGMLGTCKANAVTLKAALDDQSGRVLALQQEGAERTAATDKAIAQSKAAVAKLEARAAEMLAYQAPGDDSCGRVSNTLSKYRESLK